MTLIHIEVNDEKKIVSLWMTNAEKNDKEFRAGLQDIYTTYRAQKYMVAVFLSGTDNLYDNTLDLLRYNKRRSAEMDIQREKQTAANLQPDSLPKE